MIFFRKEKRFLLLLWRLYYVWFLALSLKLQYVDVLTLTHRR